MSNYGEELEYWYLRLNGFFPITNFVIHRDETRTDSYNADADIVAIRPPNVYEDVGGAPHDWDDELRKHFDFDKTIGLICEVKTGDVEYIFTAPSVQYTVSRLGFDMSRQEKVDFLETPKMLIGERHQIGKLLIANSLPRRYRRIPFIPLEHARTFIRERMRTYIDAKYSARFFFNSTLIQEIIWEVNLEEDEKKRQERAQARNVRRNG